MDVWKIIRRKGKNWTHRVKTQRESVGNVCSVVKKRVLLDQGKECKTCFGVNYLPVYFYILCH